MLQLSTQTAGSSSTRPRRSSTKRARMLRLSVAVSWSLVVLPLLTASATSVASSSSAAHLARGGLISPSAQLPQSQSLASRFIDTVKERWQNGGDALPRIPLPADADLSGRHFSPVVFKRQVDTSNHGPDSDQPITIGSTPLTPLILLIAGMAFSFICCVCLIIIINCANPNNSQTGRDRLRAQQDLRLRGAGRRSAVEPYIFSTGASGTSSPSYGPSPSNERRLSKMDRRPPPRPAMGGSISSRTPLYASHLSQASGSVSGSERRLLAAGSGDGRFGHNSFMSTSSGPFGDSMAAMGGQAERLGSGGNDSASGSSGGYRPSPLPPPSMQQSGYDMTPGSPRGPRPYSPFPQGRPQTPGSRSVKGSRSSTIGRGTDIYKNRGSRAFTPAVNPSAIAPAYSNWGRGDYGNHPLDGPPELKRHLTDPTAAAGSLSASRRNSMLSLSMGSGSDKGSSSPSPNPTGTGSGLGGGGTSPDSASSSHLSTFSQGLTTGPLVPLGSSYLSAGGGAATGDLMGTSYLGLGSTSSPVPPLSSGGVGGPPAIPPLSQRRSPVSAGVGASGGIGGIRTVDGGAPSSSGAPPLPPAKSIYHAFTRGSQSSSVMANETTAGPQRSTRALPGAAMPPSGGVGVGSSGPYSSSSAANRPSVPPPGPSWVTGLGGSILSGGAQDAALRGWSTPPGETPVGPGSGSAAPAGRLGASGYRAASGVAQQRYDEDVEAAGASAQSGLLAGQRGGRYARRPIGPR